MLLFNQIKDIDLEVVVNMFIYRDLVVLKTKIKQFMN